MPTIQEFKMEHCAAAIALWEDTPGVGSSDTPEAIAQFLERNPGHSFVCIEQGTLVATIMCGHDGRRGYIYHLAVQPEFRRQGIATKLVAQGIDRLAEAGITKCHLFVFGENETGSLFWNSDEWQLRDDLHIRSKFIEYQASNRVAS